MLEGYVNDTLESLVDIGLKRGEVFTTIPAIVDTGFSGAVCLAERYVDDVDLTFAFAEPYELANGEILVWIGITNALFAPRADARSARGVGGWAACRVTGKGAGARRWGEQGGYRQRVSSLLTVLREAFSQNPLQNLSLRISRKLVDKLDLPRHLETRQLAFGGTDLTRMPCTYYKCITLFTEHLPWLQGEDLEWVMGRGICAWLGWPSNTEWP